MATLFVLGASSRRGRVQKRINDAILFAGSDFHRIRSLHPAPLCAEKKQTPAKPAAQAPQAKQELKMETAQLVGLIKSTIMALQHANQTGNYSVLRDLGTPVFRERFDQAQLTAIFYNLRSRGVNFTPILFLAGEPHQTTGNDRGKPASHRGRLPDAAAANSVRFAVSSN